MAEFAGTPIIAAFRERVSARPGETIHVTPDPAMVHLFDATTGRALPLAEPSGIIGVKGVRVSGR